MAIITRANEMYSMNKDGKVKWNPIEAEQIERRKLPVNNIVSLLHNDEKEIIRRYQKHLWEMSKVSLKQRDILSRIIHECGQELDIIERDLQAEGWQVSR